MPIFLLLIFLFSATPGRAEMVVDVLSPEVLRALDTPGNFSFATFLGEAEKERTFLQTQPDYLKILRFSELQQNGRFFSLSEQIRLDVEAIKKRSGEKMAYSSKQAEKLAPAGNVARHFDPYWLSSRKAAAPLIGVINRIDKRDFYQDTCGELRFIYRIAYTEGSSRSTLPVFFNVVFDYLRDESGSCQNIAQSWQSQIDSDDAEKFTTWLLSKPLEKNKIRFKQLELNMQIVRFPSGQKTDFGGQAIYSFRIFQAQDRKFVSIPLENTPNVGLVRDSPSLQKALVEQLSKKENLQKIDEGTFILEDSEGQLLARQVLSFSTTGRARLANKPFTTLLGPGAEKLPAVDLSSLSFVRTKPALVERLNNLSCVGCHQNGGTAGFHFLGMAGTLNSSFNQVILPFSPHYHAEKNRRVDYVGKLSKGNAPNTFRPPSFFPSANWSTVIPQFAVAKARDLCVEGGFSQNIGCENGSHCQVTVKNSALGYSIGECVADKNKIAGHICRLGDITNANLNVHKDELYNLNAFQDSIDSTKVFSASGLTCSKTVGGSPLGRISKGCDANSAAGRLEWVDQLDTTHAPPKEICAIRGGTQFDECAASANPPECLAKAPIARGLLDTCYVGNFCREDYICQRLPEDVSRLYSSPEKEVIEKRIEKLGSLGIGFCVPNYFVFNMRSDGHILPEGRQAEEKRK